MTRSNVPVRYSQGLDREAGWFHEGTVPGRRHGNMNHGFRITELVHCGRTVHQDVLIFDNPVFGRVLVLDGIVQLSTFDEARYHEMLVHPPMLTHPHPERVLVVGGGDGGTLREVLRHDPREVAMIDLDEDFVRQAARYLPSLSAGAFQDPRVTLLHEDASMAIDRYVENFDVVIVDCNDAIGPSSPLFESPFYAAIARSLRPGGLCSVQVGSFLDVDFIVGTRRRLAAHLPRTTPFRFTMPSYHCGEYCFLVASRDRDPAGPHANVISDRLRARGIKGLRFYSPRLHHASQVMHPNVELSWS